MKRRGLLTFGSVFLGVILLVNLMSFVSAQPVQDVLQSIGDVIDAVWDGGLRTFTESALGTPTSASDFLYRLFFFIIILTIVYSTVGIMPMFRGRGSLGTGGITVFIISVIVSILAVRFISEQWINAILLPYSALGIFFTAGLPFLIVGYAIFHNIQSRTGRSVAWIFFGVILIGFWITRFNEVGGAGWIYVAWAGACFIMILLDSTLHGFIAKVRAERAIVNVDNKQISRLQARMKEIDDGYESAKDAYVGTTPKGSALTGYKAYVADMKWIRDEITRLKTAI